MRRRARRRAPPAPRWWRSARRCGQVCQPERLAQPHEDALVAGRDRDLLVGGLVGLVGDDARVAVAAALAVHARRDPRRALVEQARQRGVHQRHLDVAAAAGARALDQRGLDAVGRQQPADEVDDRGAGLQRPPVRLAGDRHQAAHGLQQEVVAGQPARRPRALPNAVTEQETSPGFAARSVSPSSPNSAISPGRKDSIITSARSASVRASARSSASLRSSAIERLLRFSAEVVGADAVAPRRAPGARVVAAVGALDLDHVGAEVAEQHRGQRAGEHAREVGDEDPVQRRHGRAH